MMENKKRRSLVKQYYLQASHLIHMIEKYDLEAFLYPKLLYEYLFPGLHHIEEQQCALAMRKYVQILRFVENILSRVNREGKKFTEGTQ